MAAYIRLFLHRNKTVAMTKKQNEDFAKLELAYLDKVRERNPDGQIRQMEVIFYWIRRQIAEARMAVIIQLPLKNGQPNYDGNPSEEITDGQKGEFTFLQMAMIMAAYRPEPDRELMVEVELKMREWIDKQITASINRLLKPQMKVIVKPDQQTRYGKN
jgi:hypothetical protein